MAKLGVEHLKNLAVVGFGIVKGISDATADGFQITDVFTIIPTLMPIPALVKSKAEIVAEWNDRDDDEKAEIIKHLETSFSIASKKAEAIIEDVLAAGLHIVSALTKYETTDDSGETKAAA